MSNPYSLLYYWRFKNYQLNFLLEDFFRSKLSCFNFAADIEGLLLKTNEQIYPDPKTTCWEVNYPSYEEFIKNSPYFTLIYRQREEIFNGSKFILLDDFNYSDKEMMFERVELSTISLQEFAAAQTVDISFEPMLFKVLKQQSVISQHYFNFSNAKTN